MELKECTFFPNSQNRTIAKVEVNDEELGNEIYQRNLNWEQQRLQKIQEEQERKKDLEIVECTFVPRLEQPHHLVSGSVTSRFRHARKSNMTNLEHYNSKVSNIGADANYNSMKTP